MGPHRLFGRQTSCGCQRFESFTVHSLQFFGMYVTNLNVLNNILAFFISVAQGIFGIIVAG
jgi:hypothetical protein